MNYQQCHNNGCLFRVWAPGQHSMSLQVQDKRIPMTPSAGGYFVADVPGAGDGTRYHYVIDDKLCPDPASAFQPRGIFGPSEIVDHRRFSWTDAGWKGQPMEELIFYELHVGAFTAEGTFDAMIPHLESLCRLGINAIELMPVAEFPGDRNWGYDGVFLYAPQHSYGGPDGLKRLVDACHRQGISVFLDVVYNHIGGEGNCMGAYGPYFSENYRTPWGKAINYDGAWSDGVRDFIIGNVLYWAEHFHLDGLRLDAIHEIYDRNAVTVWDELHAAIRYWEKKSGRPCKLVAESDMNDPRVIQPPDRNGKGLDAQWMDDFHHALYTLVFPEERRHYVDFGTTEQLAKAISTGFVHSGEYVKARFRRHGASSAGIGGERFIVFVQNHDLPGNRPGGERLSVMIGDPALRLAAAAVLLSPYVPLLFMGEEYGEEAPFYFFCDYRNTETVEALREGRKKQLAGYGYTEDPPDPQAMDTFIRSKLHWAGREKGRHGALLEWYRELIRLRRGHPLLADLSKRRLRADVLGEKLLSVYRYSAAGDRHLVCLFNFSAGISHPVGLNYAALQDGVWHKLLSSAGLPAKLPTGGTISLPPQSVAVYELFQTNH